MYVPIHDVSNDMPLLWDLNKKVLNSYDLTAFLVYYIGYWVSSYLSYAANEGIGLILI